VTAVRRVRVELPQHLRTLARVKGEVVVEVAGQPTIGSLLDALEEQYPVLCGAIRDHDTLQRRPFVRYFACAEDLSHDPPTGLLPQAVVEGKEAFLVIGAIAGG
jgi:molybdopterin synthase sulfur carrier subunit